MKLGSTKKNNGLIVLLTLLFVISLGTGIYFLLKDKTTTSLFNVDKYTDIVNWCETTTQDETLSIDCKGLLLDISNPEDGNSCFEVEVITNDKELKDLTVCEKNDTLSYTNEILDYKKLMPIDMVFTYTHEGILNGYILYNISFTKLDNTYVQSIVNEDIANLVTIDPSTTTIQNSIDFCPRPEILPGYLTEENKAAYTKYFDENILTEEEYKDVMLYSWDDTTIRLLFACDSSKNLGYLNICNEQKVNGMELISSNINPIFATPKWNNKLDDKNRMLLKEISLIYDNMYLLNTPNDLTSLKLLKDLVETVNAEANLNEEILCGMYKIYDALATNDNKYQIEKESIQNLFSTDSFNTSTCSNTIPGFDDTKDEQGIYIKKYYSNLEPNLLTVYSRCQNLTNIALY